MANERLTEEIVREHFKNDPDYDKVIKEEQKSKNPKINKFLENASKSGNGCGRPEFIFSFKENPNLIMIVECKADPLKHESKNGDQYKDYAVDGVKLYSSFLSKEYDVISIAVSGEDKKDVLISHFLQVKGEPAAKSAFGNELISIMSYINGCISDESKYDKEYSELLKYAPKLNDELHALKIKESHRSLLISGILIALDDASFEKAYLLKKDAQHLADTLVSTIENQIGNALKQGENTQNIDKKIKNIIAAYNFIKTHPSLSQDLVALQKTITDVNNNIRLFIKTYPGHDVLGQFYVVFLQYSNSDKGLGIVLTPPHITELFSELAIVTKNSIILDNCTGTGGFLISGMKQMLNDAKGDKNKEMEIKKNQIIGIEYQDDIYALACSNMVIHGDGKSNLEHGSCFDENLIQWAKDKHPNVGLLNPPYKSEKTDPHEFEFILNNLSILEKGGKCVAIIPMGCVLSPSGEGAVLKQKLLNEHTLEAVFSMPNELFINSDVAVVSCIVIFTAHQPHPDNYKTYFGYYKDDGFIKRKTNGRGNYLKKWNAIKEQWIANYFNKVTVAGFSVMKHVTSKDEWCAEAYMETDHSTRTKFDFINTVKNFVVFKFSNNLITDATSKCMNTVEPILNAQTQKSFKLSDIFELSKGNAPTKEYLINGSTPLIASIEGNNGVRQYISEKPTASSNTITVSGNGSIGEAFYQQVPYCASSDVNILSPKFKLNPYIGLFITTIIHKEKYRFNYGRKWNLERMNKSTIKLPATADGKPDFEFMENYIKSLPYSASL